MKAALALLAMFVLVGCEPVAAPYPPASKPATHGSGVSVTGSARVGVVYGPN